MSKVSSKSRLSPNLSKGSSAINLGKNSPIDLRKTQPSLSSGGIGVTHEVGNIGGLSITGGVSVDVSPVRVSISGNPDYEDPSKNSISISGNAEIPGGFLGIGGGVTINTSTGEITGGSIGGEALGLGINISGTGIEFTLQIPGTPITLSLELGYAKEEPPPPPPPTPTLPSDDVPTPLSQPLPPGAIRVPVTIPPIQDPIYEPGLPTTGIIKSCRVVIKVNYRREWMTDWGAYKFGEIITNDINVTDFSVSYKHKLKHWNLIDPEWQAYNYTEEKSLDGTFSKPFQSYGGFRHQIPSNPDIECWYSTIYANKIGSSDTFGFGYEISGDEPAIWDWISRAFQRRDQRLFTPPGWFASLMDIPTILRSDGTDLPYPPYPRSPNNESYDIRTYQITVLESSCGLPQLQPSPNVNTPPKQIPPKFPNSPPRKNMDECCRDSVRLLRRIHKHLGVSPVTGMEPIEQFAGVKTKGEDYQGGKMNFPFEVPKVWLDVQAKKTDKIFVRNLSELLLVMGAQSERLERVLGTKEFIKDSEGKLRQSEGNLLSWISGKNPDFAYPDPNDFWLNTDDGIINEKRLEVRSLTDAVRYTVEAINRLERILPIAELKDSSIPARWIYPNGKGQLRVGNLIHLCEYMIRKSDKDMGYWPQKITIKAANPAIKDDEAITTDVHSQADMLRVMMQQILDIEGDGDMGSNYDLRRTYLDIMAFQMTVKNTKYLQAISEYLGFDITEEVSKIPIPFDPFAGQERSVIEKWWLKYGFGEEKTNFPTKNTESEIEQLSTGLLQNSELEVNTIKFGSVDAKKDPKTLKEALIEILKHSSVSAAAVSEVATESALDRVVDAAGIAQKLASFLMRRDIREALGVGDLDNWISSAEKGYTDNLESESLRFPESNSLEPYGRPATQNPTIREIDTKDKKAD